jgi:hypothetical protein
MNSSQQSNIEDLGEIGKRRKAGAKANWLPVPKGDLYRPDPYLLHSPGQESPGFQRALGSRI